MADPISTVLGAGVSLSDLASDINGTANKEALVDDIRRKNTARQERLEKLRDQALLQQTAFKQGAKINPDAPPPTIFKRPPEAEGEYIGRRVQEEAYNIGKKMMPKATGDMTRKYKTPPKSIVKQAYDCGFEQALGDLGISGLEKEAFVLPALKAGWNMLRRGSQAIGLTGTKYKNLTGATKTNPFTGGVMHTGVAPGKNWARGTNPQGQAAWAKKGWWGRQSTSNKVQAGLGAGTLGVGYLGSKAVGAHNKAMNSPGALEFKLGKPNSASARLAAKTYGQ